MSAQHCLIGIVTSVCILAVTLAGCTQAPPPAAPATPAATSSTDSLPSADSVSIDIPEPTASEPVAWGATVVPTDVSAGGKALLVVRAKIAEGWHIYAAEGSTGVGRPTKLQLTLPAGYTAETWELPHAEVKSTQLGDVSHYKHTATFAVPIQVGSEASGAADIGCEISFQSCTDVSCLPPTSTSLSIPVTVTN